MEQSTPVDNEPTRSLLTIDLSCPVCLKATVEVLESNPDVTAVTAHSAQGCLEVTHRGPVDSVLQTISSIGHTIEVGSNGEAVMAPATARVTTSCHRHDSPDITHIAIGESDPDVTSAPEPADKGGDPPCWSHLDDIDDRDASVVGSGRSDTEDHTDGP